MEEIGSLTEEMQDLYSSFNSNISECENPFFDTFSTSENVSENNITFNSSETLMEHHQNSFISDENVNIPETVSFTYNEKSSGFREYHERVPSFAKVKEFKQVLAEVKNAYVAWKTSQFVLGCYESSESDTSPRLAAKMKEVITNTIALENAHITGRSGEKFNLLGLDDEDLESLSGKTLSYMDKDELNKHAMTVVKANVEKLSAERKHVVGLLGTHCLTVSQPDTLLSEERGQLAQLHETVRDQLDQACQLLVSSNQAMQQLSHLLRGSEQDLQKSTYTFLHDKALYLQTVVSILKLKTEQSLHSDPNQTTALNTLGDNLKTSVDEASNRLKSLQKALGQYEKKETTSKKYNEIITEYNKAKRQLHHKYQTLDVLNEPDTSFS